MHTRFAPNTSEADLFSLDTPKGRRHFFNKRIDELTKPKAQGGPGLSLDEALFQMRTGGNADDYALLEAMGEKPSHFRTEKLQQQKHTDRLKRLAEENLDASKTSAEVASALAISNRRVAFNARISELMDRGFSTDQAITQMRANPNDAALLQAMGAA